MANWYAGQLAGDNFNRPDASDLGTNWHVGTDHGPTQIVSQQIQPYPAGGPQPSKQHYIAYGTFPNDQWSEMQVIFEDTTGDAAAEVRASDTADTMYVCDVNLSGPISRTPACSCLKRCASRRVSWSSPPGLPLTRGRFRASAESPSFA
jgi:hypothetical protein